MWNGLTRLPSMLQELINLTREQNSLLRELIQITSGRAALTPASTSLLASARAAATSGRKRTAADVTVVSRLPSDEVERRQREHAAGEPSPLPVLIDPADPTATPLPSQA